MPETALEPIRDFTRLTPADIALILKLADDGRKQTDIAQVVGCSQSTVSQALHEFTDTREIAKRLANRAAEKLTKRVIDEADVDQSLEVLDRIGVLEKRQQESGRGNNVLVVIGTPGKPAGTDPFGNTDAVITVQAE